jgi:hypothetical protein
VACGAAGGGRCYDSIVNDSDYILGSRTDAGVSLTIWLIVKGFQPSPILTDEPARVPQTS